NTANIIQLISKGIVGIFYLIALPIILKRNKNKICMVYLITLIIFVLNFILFRENRIYLRSIAFSLFFTSLPSFIYAYSIRSWNVLMNIMKKASIIIFIVGALLSVSVFMGNISIGAYSMSLSYYMLLPSVISFNDFIETRSLTHLVISIVSLSIIFAFGARGLVLCWCIFVSLKSIHSFKILTS